MAFRAVAVCGPACCRVAHGHPTGVLGRSGLPGGQAQTDYGETSMVWARRLTKYGTKATQQHYTTRTHTDTLGLRNGPVKWPQRCASLHGARPIGQTDRQRRWTFCGLKLLYTMTAAERSGLMLADRQLQMEFLVGNRVQKVKI